MYILLGLDSEYDPFVMAFTFLRNWPTLDDMLLIQESCLDQTVTDNYPPVGNMAFRRKNHQRNGKGCARGNNLNCARGRGGRGGDNSNRPECQICSRLDNST